MSHCLVKEMLASHLERLSALATLHRQGSSLWLPQVEAWLEEAEKLMARFRFAEGGVISAARGNIAKALDMPGAVEQNPRRQAERRCRAAAQEAVDEAARLLAERARRAEDALRAFEEKLCEGLTAYFLQHPPEEAGEKPTPSALWRGLKTCESTRALALYMEASLDRQDRLYLFERIQERLAGHEG